MENTATNTAPQVISPEQLLQHWQGHRRLTRKVIEAFPEEAFFNHKIGGMRTFADMVKELLAIAEPGLKEIVGGEKQEFDETRDYGNKKSNLLKQWDIATKGINDLWTKLSVEDFAETKVLFGQYEFSVLWHIFYFIDNEIHHRGQAYVYLRSLGIEPPLFYERD